MTLPTTILTMDQATKKIDNGLNEQNIILDHVDLTIQKGDFITVLGGNGAGKSTLFNVLAGSLPLTSGNIRLKHQDITNWKEEKRATAFSRVFQDPKQGTAPRMTVAENLLLALHRGEKRTIKRRELKENKPAFYEMCASLGNGLENHLDTPTGNLSGGQRQALSLLMATLKDPELLLLDEHTAALDPKTAKQLMKFTNQRIQEKELTCLMITHRMEDALQYGNRLLLLKKGKIKKDLNAQAKKKLTLNDLFLFFEEED